MRKFITILMIIAMVSLPGRYATAGGDGGITQVLVSALSQPGGFAVVTVLQVLVLTVLMGQSAKVKPTSISALSTLQLTVTLTVVYFLYALINYARYYLFYVFYIQPYFMPFAITPGGTSSTTDSSIAESEQKLKDAIWEVSDPKAANDMAAAAAEEEDDEQAAIDAAVDRALKDPELAKKYLRFASPRLRNAVIGALNNQMFESLKSEMTRIQPPNAAQAGNFSGVSAAAGR